MLPEALHQSADIALTLYVPLALGYALRKLGLVGSAWTRPVMVWLIVLVEPPITMYSLWVLRSGDVAAAQSLLVGIGGIVLAAAVVATATIFIARLISEALGHDPRTRGAFIGCSVFSNNGFTLGVFICLLFLGIRGQSIGLVYTIYFLPYFVVIGFALGRHYGNTKKITLKQHMLSLFTEPMSVLPLTGVVIGLVLHQIAPRPPDWVLPVNKTVVHVEVAVYAFAIGCTLSLRSVRKYWRECLACCGMKFAVMPIIGLAVVFLLRHLGVLSQEPIVQKVILIQTFMPAAILSVVLAKLFRLNEDLASSCWVVTTVASAAVLPLVYLVVA